MPGLRSWKTLYLLGYFALAGNCRFPAQSLHNPSITATVEGTIAVKGLPDVTVRLEKVPTDPLSSFDGYLATVEPDGRFHFEDIAPGSYRLTANSSSQMHGEFGSTTLGIPGTVLELKGGEARKDLTFDLFPDPVGICGHVLDADGNPVRTDVEIYTPQFTGPTGAELQPTRNPIVLTDPNGYFMLAGSDQLAVGPGPHFLSTFNQRYSRFFLRANGVWYPSTESFADAVAIPALPISQSGCTAVIRMPRTRCVGHRVIAKVEDMPVGRQGESTISLYEVNPANLLFQKDSQAPIYNTDHVEFDNECDGSYAFLNGNHSSGLFHVAGKDVDVTVTDNDQQAAWRLTNQQDIWDKSAPRLPPPAPASIQGSLELVDGLTWKQACPAGVSQQLALELGPSFEQGGRSGSQRPISATLDKGGNFSFGKLEPGSYSLNLGSFAHGAAYLKSIQLNGKPLSTLDFTLAAGEAAELKVEVSNDPAEAAGKPRAGNTPPHYLLPGTHPAASIEGKVTGPDAAGAKLKLTSLRTGTPSNFGAAALDATAASDGSFRIDGIAPGMYKLSTEGDHHQYSEYGAKGPGLDGAPIVLTAGAQRQGLEVKTYARPSVCGTVFGADGRPRSGIEVWVRDTTNDLQGNNSTKHEITDAHGKYAIAEVGPGERQLWAKDGDTITYFPADVAGAVHHNAFADVLPQQGCVFNIYLRRADGASALAHTVSGAIDGKFDASLGDRFYMELEPTDRKLTLSTPGVERVQMKEPGSFTLKNVFPGKYTLTFYGEYGNGFLPCPMPSCPPMPGYYHHPLASQQITVTNRNVEGLHLSVGTLPTLDGEFVVDGALPQGWTSLRLTLFWGNESKKVDADIDRHFSFAALDAFRYGFSITDRAPGEAYEWGDSGPAYIASATLDGKPIAGQHFELHNGQKAHLVIRVKVGATRGNLTVAAGGPPVDPYPDPCSEGSLRGRAATLLMIPDPLPDDNAGIIAVAADPSNNEGYVRSAPPGHYHVVAVDNVGIPTGRGWGQTVAATSHDFLVKLAALGNPVDLVAGQEFRFTAPFLTEQAQRLMVAMETPATH